jgi:hypothetical protein
VHDWANPNFAVNDDIMASVGAQTPTIHSITCPVFYGYLSIQLIAKIDNGKISATEVIPMASGPSAPIVPSRAPALATPTTIALPSSAPAVIAQPTTPIPDLRINCGGDIVSQMISAVPTIFIESLI